MDKQEYAARVAWLRRYQDALRERKRLAQRLAEVRAQAVRMSPYYSSARAQSRDGVSAAERAVERIEDARAMLLDQELACKALYAETMRAIMALPDAKGREVLRRWYLHGQCMEQIAGEMRITERHAKRLHHEAVCGLDMSPLTC